MKNIIILLSVLIISGLGLYTYLEFSKTDIELTEDELEVTNELSEVEKILESKLPYQLNVEGREVVFDSESVELVSREFFNERIDVGIILNEDQDPIEYTQKQIISELSQEHIIEQKKSFFNYSVSFYSGDTDNQIIAMVRLINLPDDSVGATEERYDFQLDNTVWSLNWYGDRQFCRRMDNEYWAKPGKLCP